MGAAVMGAPQTFKVGEAPWETGADQPAQQAPQTFKVGEAPWEQQSPAQPQGDAGGAALEGFGQGAALGYLPQLQAAASKPIYAALNLITGQDVQPDSYVQERDNNIARQADLAKSNPYAYYGSQVAGGLDTAIAGAAALPEAAATIPGRLKQAAQVSGAIGALQNPGDTTGDIDPIQALARAKNAGIGAVAGGATGALLETPGLVSSGVNAAKNAIASRLGASAEYTPIANKEEVEAAANALGINNLPKGVLTDNPTFQKLESGLSQSGSFPAKTARDQYRNLMEGLDAASNKIDDMRSVDSPHAIGGQIQSELENQIQGNTAPVSELYKDLNPVLSKIEVDNGVVNRQFGALKRNPLFSSQQGMAALDDAKQAVLGQPELASLKEFRSTLQDSLGNNSSPLDSKRVDAIYDAVTKIRDGSIQATKASLPPQLHGEVDALANQIGLADAAHASNVDDINSIGKLVGNKPFKSPTQFLNALNDMSEEALANKASNLDVGTLQNIQQKFPTVFDKVRTAKINDMIQGSTNPISGFSDTRFLKQWDGMGQEMRDMIFDNATQDHINALQTLKQAIPPKLGPSGTPDGHMTMQMFDPKRNLADFAIKRTLDNAVNGSSAAAASPAGGGIIDELKQAIVRGRGAVTNRPIYDGSSRPSLVPAANSAGQPQGGPDKWANDGLQKLQKHGLDSSVDTQKLMNDPQGRQLLVAASVHNPGSDGMQDVADKVEDLYGDTDTGR